MSPTMKNTITTTTFLAAALSMSSMIGSASAGCLDFVDLHAFDTNTCFRGALTCIGSVDENCHIGENQFLVDVDDKLKSVRDPQTGLYRVGIKLENEGYGASMIETVWVEDDYNLLSGYFEPSPVTNAGHTNFRAVDVDGNSNADFTDAHAHGVDFLSHFVVSETDMSRKLRRSPKEEDTRGVWNSSKKNTKHDFVTINFESECNAEEIETAIEYGLIRVGVKGSHFEHKPKQKAFVSCWDRLDVVFEAEELGIE